MEEKLHQCEKREARARQRTPRTIATKQSSKRLRKEDKDRVERVKKFTVFATRKQDGEAGNFFTALSSIDILIAPKRNLSIHVLPRARVRFLPRVCAFLFMCVNPVSAWLVGTTEDGKKRLSFKPSPFSTSETPQFSLPCGRCIGCQTDRRNRWISRLMLEHFCRDSKGAFVTLTYADAPSRLLKTDVQKFLKKFRNIPRDYKISLPDFTYFFCGEYGSRKGRPHYHGLLFGVDPFAPEWKTDIVLFKDGHPIFSSALLADVWRKGFVTVDVLTPANIRYVTKYLLKRYCSKGDEFTLKSIGLGSDFFFNFGDKRSNVSVGKYYDLYERGLIHLPSNRGKMCLVPIPSQSFDRYVELLSPSDLDSLKLSRKQFRINHPITPQIVRDKSAWLNIQLAEKNERVLHEN